MMAIISHLSKVVNKTVLEELFACHGIFGIIFYVFCYLFSRFVKLVQFSSRFE